MKIVAALYIDPRGPYPTLPAVECWDEARDATLYRGPHPVVAHPPCGPWGRLSHLCRRLHERPLAMLAVKQLRTWGGVLEHPAGSRLWAELDLPLPGAPPSRGLFTREVCQVDWGHVARKRTWLLFRGIDETLVDRLISERPFPDCEPTHWVSGGRGRVGKKSKTTPVPPGIKVCSAQQRRRTPKAFAEFLIACARATR